MQLLFLLRDQIIRFIQRQRYQANDCHIAEEIGRSNAERLHERHHDHVEADDCEDRSVLLSCLVYLLPGGKPVLVSEDAYKVSVILASRLLYFSGSVLTRDCRHAEDD